jgi:putative membrane protein
MRWRDYEPRVLLGLTVAGLVASGIAPHSRLAWLFDVPWVIAGVVVLPATRRRFPLTPLLYRLLFLHAVFLIVGGHYTYERVPLGEWAREAFGLRRNPYDRLGHFLQGFVPAILAREILLRRSPLGPGKWLFFLVTCVCLAFSAFFELMEWWLTLISGQDVQGMQGDPWDAQWDMFMALVGAVTAQALLGRRHDRELRELGAGAPGERVVGWVPVAGEGPPGPPTD